MCVCELFIYQCTSAVSVLLSSHSSLVRFIHHRESPTLPLLDVCAAVWVVSECVRVSVGVYRRGWLNECLCLAVIAMSVLAAGAHHPL